MPLADRHSITRRDLIRGAATGMISLAMRADTLGGQPSTKPHNIIFILADDLGYADVSCYGRPDMNTPNIDRIATRGIRFLQGYANSAVCSATRTALITGRYQYRLRIGLEEPLAGNVTVGLPPEHPTLPSLLKKAGYSSTLVGKWHLGVVRPTACRLERSPPRGYPFPCVFLPSVFLSSYFFLSPRTPPWF